MTKKIKTIILLAAIALMAGLISPNTFATTECDTVVKKDPELWNALGCGNDDEEAPQITDVVMNIINAVITIGGIICVVYVVIGGIKYMTSIGNPDKIKQAKSTILYALIGLAICALAAAIVNFGIGILTKATTPTPKK